MAVGDRSVMERYAVGGIGPRLEVADVGGLETRLAGVEEGLGSTLSPVANLAALKAIAAADLTDKVMVFVETLGLWRLDTASAAVADDVDVVRPTAFAATNGRFFRITGLTPAIASVTGLQAALDAKITRPVSTIGQFPKFSDTNGSVVDSGVAFGAVATAQTTANTAVTNAATAQTQANTATTNAATAQTTANTGVTNAATALSAANARQYKTYRGTFVGAAATGLTGAVTGESAWIPAANDRLIGIIGVELTATPLVPIGISGFTTAAAGTFALLLGTGGAVSQVSNTDYSLYTFTGLFEDLT